MPYKNKADRNVAREYQLEKLRPGAHEARMERQRARRAMDKTGTDKNHNGEADRREGKDIDHIRGTKAGNGKDNLRIRTPAQNRSYSRNADHTVKKNEPLKKKPK